MKTAKKATPVLAAPKPEPLVLFAIADLDKPLCGHEHGGCDPKEDPDHWVSIKLSEEVKERLHAAMRNLFSIGMKEGERGKRCRQAWAGLREILDADMASV